MSDDPGKYNKERWEALAQANVEWSRPWLELDAQAARQHLDTHGILGDVTGKRVLALGAGGGQQSAAFALLGAVVTVLDISETQLARDQQALAHYGLQARLEQGDMRDLSRFEDNSFDLVWNAWSISFVPDVAPVFDEVRRVLRPGGGYLLNCANPFSGAIDETDWTGEGYLIKRPYANIEWTWEDMDWDIEEEDGTTHRVPGPREFNHTLSTVLNGLIQRGFILKGLWEEETGDPDAAPGTWEHLKSVAPHALTMWAVLS